MKKLALEILKEGFFVLKSRDGGILILINFIFFLIFGLVTLISGILILGPAAMLLKDPHVVSGVLVFFLLLLFIEVVVLFVVFEQFIILTCLYRIYEHHAPIFTLTLFQEEKERFLLYIKSCLTVLVKICIGLILFILPGLRAFFRFLFIGPISIFEYQGQLTADETLKRSENLTEPHFWLLVLGGILFIVILFLSHLILGQLLTQLVLMPVLATYLTICIVILYRRESRRPELNR